MTISVRLDSRDEQLFKTYAQTNNLTMSELIRSAVLEKIETEYDLKIYREAMEEYNANPIRYSHDEVCKMLEIE
ncbi:MAG: DUF6290 family protein [Eubacteriales bacterium]|nr:DUF6290 family protein [Eubacteriales bacterium]